ncbi:hypothetical protein C8F01DRAFT_1127018 [Mycena amicta]|nr:hypothetical protein C8F01DRAFT_1127018 [Mycena amicta]
MHAPDKPVALGSEKPSVLREALLVKLLQKPWKDLTPLEKQLWNRLGDEHQRSKRPDKHTKLVEWNEHFEREIAFKYRRFEGSALGFHIPEQVYGHMLRTSESEDIVYLNQLLADYGREMLVAEGQLVMRAVDCLVDRGMKAEWSGFTRKKRAELVLEGLYRGACQSPRDNSRDCCPEMTIAGLTGDGEFALIRMLEGIVAHDPTGNGRVKELYFFKHPSTANEFVAKNNAPEHVKAHLRYAEILRNIFIVKTLVGILEAYVGHPREPVLRANIYKPKKSFSETRRKMRQTLRQNFKQVEFYVDQSQSKEHKGSANICAKCHEPSPRGELKRCSRCQMVWYCSSQCQNLDWKEHKRACGLKQFDLDAVAPVPEGPAEFIGCPAVAQGFIRSPALWLQIWYLSKEDSQLSDYHFDTTPGHTSSFNFFQVDPEMQVDFLLARRRAMATGSRAAVAKMLSLIPHAFKFFEITHPLERMRDQLVREYRIAPFADWNEVEKLAADFDLVGATDQEEEEELKFRKERHEKYIEYRQKREKMGEV